MTGITGVHALIYSAKPDEVRAFLRDVLDLSSVDAGGGWLIFALPPAELGVHPIEGAGHHELSLMCEDIDGTVARLREKGVEFRGDIGDRAFGRSIEMMLPDRILYIVDAMNTPVNGNHALCIPGCKFKRNITCSAKQIECFQALKFNLILEDIEQGFFGQVGGRTYGQVFRRIEPQSF